MRRDHTRNSNQPLHKSEGGGAGCKTYETNVLRISNLYLCRASSFVRRIVSPFNVLFYQEDVGRVEAEDGFHLFTPKSILRRKTKGVIATTATRARALYIFLVSPLIESPNLWPLFMHNAIFQFILTSQYPHFSTCFAKNIIIVQCWYDVKTS